MYMWSARSQRENVIFSVDTQSDGGRTLEILQLLCTRDLMHRGWPSFPGKMENRCAQLNIGENQGPMKIDEKR